MTKLILNFTAPILGIVCLAGCGDEKYPPVSGRVTMEGKPWVKILVRFQPTGGTLSNPGVGRGSYAVTDSNGEFTMKVSSKQEGAAVARHRVSFSTPGTPRIELIPKKFNSESQIYYEVAPGGTDLANFDLKMDQ